MATVHLVGARNEPTPRAEERGDARTSFGEWIRRAREARGLTLDGITQQTRIPRRHLEAIEGGNLTMLPEFYQRAEVRAFARAVGVDEELALSRLQTAVKPVEAPADVPRAQPARRFSTMHVALALGAVVLASALVARVIFERSLATAGVAGSPGTTGSQQPPREARDDAGASGPGLPSGDAGVPSGNAAVPSGDALPAAPAPAVATPPITTVLVVTTQPPGARVTVNGIGWGMSPVAIRHLPPGNKLIRVSKDGYGAA
jgi:cytoskeletal protein RodZ